MLQRNFLSKIVRLLSATFLLCSFSSAQHLVRFEIDQYPAGHSNDSFFFAGNINGWNPGVSSYAFIRNKDGKLFAELKGVASGLLEFKVTRGSWKTVEVATNGASVSNRIARISSDTIIKINIAAWADDFPGRPPVSTRSKNVFVIDTSFFIPQLNRKRRIWVYLPEDYVFTNKRYAVTYMHDGQNLFDAVTSSFGEWGVDEMMDSVKPRKQNIIVGIDHGGNQRLTEYNPYNSKFGNGEGDGYVDFLVQTLKPYIDRTYRTKTGKESTAIAGSSMGGLISLYAVLKYPDVFGAAGIFSPAFWIAPELKNKIDSVKQITAALYFVCGELESDSMVPDMKAVYNSIKLKGNKRMFYSQVPLGKHQEIFWRNELPGFYQWLLIHQTK